MGKILRDRIFVIFINS
jgi:hypothetical protein